MDLFCHGYDGEVSKHTNTEGQEFSKDLLLKTNEKINFQKKSKFYETNYPVTA